MSTLKRFFTIFIVALMGVQNANARSDSLGRPIMSTQVSAYIDTSVAMWWNVSTSMPKQRQITPEDIEILLKKVQSKGFQPPGGVVHTSQTMLQMFIVAYAHALKQNSEINKAHGKSWSENWLLTMGITAQHVLSSFDIYAGFLGGAASSVIFKKPMDSLMQSLKMDTSLKAKFGTMLHRGTMWFAQTVGFEAGSQLIQDSIFSLKDKKDIEVARNLNIYNLLTNSSTDPKQQEKIQRERAVFGKLLVNMFLIMTFLRPAKTKRWIYNTWRNRLATGDFAVMTLCFSAGTRIGTTLGATAGGMVGLAPGSAAGATVGLAGGFIFGTIGGILSAYIPQEYKDPITEEMRMARIQTGLDELAANRKSLERITAFHDQDHGEPKSITSLGPLLMAIYAREKISRIDLKALEANAALIVKEAKLFNILGEPDIERQNSLLRLVYDRDKIPSADQEALKKNGREIMRVIASPVPALFRRVLEKRRNIRSNIITVYMERYSMALIRMKTAEEFLKALNDHYITKDQNLNSLENINDIKQLLSGDIKYKQYTIKDYDSYLDLKRQAEERRDAAIALAQQIENEMLEFYNKESRNQIGEMLYDDKFKENLKVHLTAEMQLLDGLHMVLRMIFAGQFIERIEHYGLEEVKNTEMEAFKRVSDDHIDGSNIMGFVENDYRALAEKLLGSQSKNFYEQTN